MRTRPAVLVYGANGTIGQLVAATLNAAGFAVRVAGRSFHRRVTLADTAALVGLASAAQVVVNCAGPYAETGRPVLDACLHAGAHYLDVCGESRFAAAVFGHRDALARARGVLVCPAMGAKGALGDWAISLLHDVTGAQDFALAYAHEGSAYWHPTLGALLSMAHEGVAWEANRPRDHGPRLQAFAFPPPMRPGHAVAVSGTEQFTATWQRPARVQVYLAVDPGTPANGAWSAIHGPAWAWLTRPTAPRLWRALLQPARRDALRRRLGPPGRGAMSLVAETPARRLGIHVPGPYAATAAIVLEAVMAIVRRAGGSGGVLAPSQVLGPNAALEVLEARGLVRVFRGGRTR